MLDSRGGRGRFQKWGGGKNFTEEVLAPRVGDRDEDAIWNRSEIEDLDL